MYLVKFRMTFKIDKHEKLWMDCVEDDMWKKEANSDITSDSYALKI